MHERDVLALDATRPQHVGESLVGDRIARQHEQAGRVAIEPVHDPGALGILATGDAVRQQPVHERRLAQARCRVGDEAGRLVDDQQVVVLEHDVEIELDRLETGAWILERDLDQLAPAQPQRLPCDGPVDRDPACGHVAFGRGARADLVQLGEEAIEADAARIAGNRELEHPASAVEAARAAPRLRGRRRGTASTGAARRRRR